jgi:hypothetical protein
MVVRLAAGASGSFLPQFEFLISTRRLSSKLVDHMVPADELSPKGTEIGINIYIDRALAGGWGKGERLYMQGPWKLGTPSQGYQLPLTPRATLSRRHRSDQRALSQDLWQDLRPARRAAAGGGAPRVVRRQGELRQRVAGACVLDHRLSDGDGRDVFGPDLRRQSRQGGLEINRLPRGDRGQRIWVSGRAPPW